MNAESLSLIGIRLISIYLMASGIAGMTNLPLVFSGIAQDNLMQSAYVLAIVSPLMVGIILYAFSRSISKLVSGTTVSAESAHVGAKIEELQGIAFAIAGLLIVAIRFPIFVRIIVFINQSAELNEGGAEYFSNFHFLAELFVLLLGLSLFFGARFWTRLYGELREFGLKNK